MANTDEIMYDLSGLPTDNTELLSKIHISNPRDNAGGKGKSARVGFGRAEKIVYFQSSRVYCPFGTNVYKADSGIESTRLLITLRKDAKGVNDFIRLVKAMDEAVVKHAFENQDLYFGTAAKDYKSLEIIKDRHHPIYQERDMYDPQLKLKVDENLTRVYDKSQGMARVEGTNVPPQVTGRAIVAFGPVWCVSGKFGMMVRCEQFLIINAGMSIKRGFDTCVLKDDDDEDDDKAARADEADGPYVPY